MQEKEELNVKFEYLNADRVLCAANQSLQDVKLKEETLESTVFRNGLGRDYGLVERQTKE